MTKYTHNNHVLLSRLPLIQATQHNLRPGPHNLKLPEKHDVNFSTRVFVQTLIFPF